MEKRSGGDVWPRHYVRQTRRRPLLHREPRSAGRRRPATLAAQYDVRQQHATRKQVAQRPHFVGEHSLRTRFPRSGLASDEEKQGVGNHL